MLIRRAAGAALLLAVFIALAGAQGSPELKALHVEVDIFSGRPNPSWELNAEDTAEFLKRFRALPVSESNRTIADGLGYRGLIIAAKDSVVEAFDTIVLSKGVVLVRKARSSRTLIDKDRAFERWLLNTGKSHLDPAIYKEAMNGL